MSISMKAKRYGVYDSTGVLLRTFENYKQAETYKISRHRMDWKIDEVCWPMLNYNTDYR